MKSLPSALVPAALAALAAILGVVGYRAACGETTNLADASYASLQLFALNGSPVEGSTPWQLHGARFLAPVAVAYAAVLTVMTLLREQVMQYSVAVRAREHVLMVGLGRTGFVMATRLREAGWAVVGLDADARSFGLRAARARGVSVLVGDATVPKVLQRARLYKAQHVVIAVGDDGGNLAVARSVARTADRSGEGRRLHVFVDNSTLWQELERLQLRTAAPFATQYVNVADRAAQLILDRPACEPNSGVGWRIFLDTETALGARLAVHIARRGFLAGVRPLIAVPRSDTGLLNHLEAEEPWCLEHCDFSALATGDVPDGDFDFAVVARSPAADDEALARGMRLARSRSELPVLVAVRRDGNPDLVEVAQRVSAHLRVVLATLDALAGELVARSFIEMLARARHEGYRKDQLARSNTGAKDRTLLPWVNLPEPWKASNREFATFAERGLREVGVVFEPLAGPPLLGEQGLESVVVERLAAAEHQRWCNAMQEAGWNPTSGPKDAERKRHPLLVPWDQLKEVDRQRDKEVVFHLPEMLAYAGYAISRRTVATR